MSFFKKRRTTKQSDPIPDFDPNSDSYKCCCKQLHIVTGAKIVGVMYIVLVTIHIITASINYSKVGGLYSALFGKAVANFVLCIVGVVFLFYALRTNKRMFVYPMLIYQILFAIAMFIMIALLIKALSRSGKYLWELSHLVGHSAPPGEGASTPSTMDQESKLVVTVVLAIILLLVCIFALLVDIRYFLVIYICYKYLRDKEIYDKVQSEPIKNPKNIPPNTAIVMLDDINSYEKKPPLYEVSV